MFPPFIQQSHSLVWHAFPSSHSVGSLSMSGEGQNSKYEGSSGKCPRSAAKQPKSKVEEGKTACFSPQKDRTSTSKDNKVWRSLSPCRLNKDNKQHYITLKTQQFTKTPNPNSQQQPVSLEQKWCPLSDPHLVTSAVPTTTIMTSFMMSDNRSIFVHILSLSLSLSSLSFSLSTRSLSFSLSPLSLHTRLRKFSVGAGWYTLCAYATYRVTRKEEKVVLSAVPPDGEVYHVQSYK